MHNHSEQKGVHEERETHSYRMNVFDCIRTRRSVRKYKDKQVPWDNIVEILQAAKYAPYAGNIINCKFIVIKSEGKRRAIAEASSQQYWMQDAPIHIVVVSEPEKAERFYGTRGVRLYTIQNAGAAMQNMLITANSLGLGSCWVGAFDEEEIRNILNLPEHVNVQGIVTIGYADEIPDMPPKPRIEHVMFFEKWWGRIESPRNALGLWAPALNKAYAHTKKSISKKTDSLLSKIKERLTKKKKENKEEQKN